MGCAGQCDQVLAPRSRLVLEDGVFCEIQCLHIGSYSTALAVAMSMSVADTRGSGCGCGCGWYVLLVKP